MANAPKGTNDRRQGDDGYHLDEELTKSVLLSTVIDISQLRETVERIMIQVHTLAKAKGITPG